MADTPTGETVVQEPPKNDVTPVAAPAPQVNSNENGEVERHKKEAAQAQMRANQLENELKKIREQQEAQKQKELEEQEQYKSLYEQEKAKREAAEIEQQEAQRKAELEQTQNTIFAEFNQEAIEVAKEAGLTLTDTTDEAKNAFKERMTRIQERTITGRSVTPNNPGTDTPQEIDRAQEIQAMRAGNKEARSKLISNLPVLDAMRKQAGYEKAQ